MSNKTTVERDVKENFENTFNKLLDVFEYDQQGTERVLDKAEEIVEHLDNVITETAQKDASIHEDPYGALQVYLDEIEHGKFLGEYGENGIYHTQ
jgi:hypothetical protein